MNLCKGILKCPQALGPAAQPTLPILQRTPPSYHCASPQRKPDFWEDIPRCYGNPVARGLVVAPLRDKKVVSLPFRQPRIPPRRVRNVRDRSIMICQTCVCFKVALRCLCWQPRDQRSTIVVTIKSTGPAATRGLERSAGYTHAAF
jgi:hypothetical protein